MGLALLWSAWMECSNDVHFAASWILTPNHEKPWIVAFGQVQSKVLSVIHCRICGILCGFSAAVFKGIIVHFFEHKPNLKLGINCHLRRQWVRFVTVVDVERKSHSLGRPSHDCYISHDWHTHSIVCHMTTSVDTPSPTTEPLFSLSSYINNPSLRYVHSEAPGTLRDSRNIGWWRLVSPQPSTLYQPDHVRSLPVRDIP